MGTYTQTFDSLTPADLVSRGSMKWSRFPDVLPAWVAEMDFPVAPVIVDALRQSVDGEVFGYLPDKLATDLKHATTEFLDSEYGWSVEADRVYPTGDVLAAYEATLRLLIPPGSPVVIPTPAYMPFLSLARLMGHPVVEVPFANLDSSRPTLDYKAIGDALGAGAAMVVLCNPHNPLGLVHTSEELQRLADVVEDNAAVVFADEIHAPLVYQPHRHIPYATVSASAAAHSITATSASKAWNLPGLKCAQLIVTSDDQLEHLSPYAFPISHGAANPGVTATIAAYRHGGEWLADVRDYLAANLDAMDTFVSEHLPGAGFRIPEGTYITWLDARHIDTQGSESVADFFRDHAGVALTDGGACGEVGRGHVRLVAATPRAILTGMLERLARVWTPG